jgi:hypothetical protein
MDSDYKLTSYVVSPDSPSLCMTESDTTGKTNILIDDIGRGAVYTEYKMEKYYGYCCGYS